MTDEFGKPAIATGTVSDIERSAPGGTDVVVEEPVAPTAENVNAYMRALEDLRNQSRAAQALAADVGPGFREAMVIATDLFADEESRLTRYIEREET